MKQKLSAFCFQNTVSKSFNGEDKFWILNKNQICSIISVFLKKTKAVEAVSNSKFFQFHELIKKTSNQLILDIGVPKEQQKTDNFLKEVKQNVNIENYSTVFAVEELVGNIKTINIDYCLNLIICETIQFIIYLKLERKKFIEKTAVKHTIPFFHKFFENDLKWLLIFRRLVVHPYNIYDEEEMSSAIFQKDTKIDESQKAKNGINKFFVFSTIQKNNEVKKNSNKYFFNKEEVINCILLFFEEIINIFVEEYNDENGFKDYRWKKEINFKNNQL